MPNKQAAIKDLRKNRKHAVHNARIKTNYKALLNKSRALIKADKKDEAKVMIKSFQAAIDKAAKNGIVHKNLAARKKAALMKAVK